MRRLKIGAIIASVLVVSVLCALPFLRQRRLNAKDVGLRALYAMYDFDTLEQLDRQMATLAECTTEEVYTQLTIDCENKTLETYLKFKNEATSVIVLECTDDYIKYSLKNKFVSEDRQFIFMYKVNSDDKIYDAWEGEVLALY